ncbi:hypothetical protein ACUTQ5_12360 [Serratia sp. NA_112.1]|uniref:hypothetical protein n=1 Tax=unclassified Serratia (in: enterobacteria) TaxID=2647522 RepID=UPI004046A1F0
MMKKLLLALLLCTSGANAAVMVTHAYGYGIARPVIIAPRPVVVVTPVPVVVSAASVVAT